MPKAKKTKKIVSKKTGAAEEKPLDLTKIKQCPECGSSNVHLSEIRKEIICKDCGSIFSRLSPGREKRFRRASSII